MPPDLPSPDDPAEWLNRARSSLIHAKDRSAGVYREELCFDAQPATEKAIKNSWVTVEDYQDAIIAAEAVLAWAQRQIGTPED